MSTTRGCVPACSAAVEQPVDQRRRHAVRRGREHRRRRVRGDVLEDLVVVREAQVRQHRLQVTEELRDRLVGLAVRRDRREVEVRMRGEQPQQLAGHVARAAEHDGRRCASFTALTAARRRRRRDAERFDDVVAERGAGRHRVDRAHAHLLLDDVDADGVVGRRARHRAAARCRTARAAA